MELPVGDLTFPLASPIEDGAPPSLDDQNCFEQTPEFEDDDAIEQLFADYTPEDEEDLLAELGRRCAEIDAWENGSEKVGEPKPVAPPEPSSSSAPKAPKPAWKPHDPTRMPDGSKEARAKQEGF